MLDPLQRCITHDAINLVLIASTNFNSSTYMYIYTHCFKETDLR